ncbi:MAG: valyl-tRNA synthetase [Thermotogaceae bacterium]|nr:valyl-tRNA synthetase [Thermotogaceae bacterium]
METLSSRYEHSGLEDKWYRYWEEKGYFIPKGEGDKFSIVIPPPNITGKIHLGHALNITIQDIIVRYKRMKGFDVLWVPGEDHAGIATQNVVEKELAKQGKRKEELGRNKFLDIVWDWANTYRKEIAKQIKALGASCDWTRERFTLDENLNRAVKKVFVELYRKGLIYKGKYIVNWCPRCDSVLSNEEVEYEEENAKLYYIKYPFEDGSGHIEIATVRPETILGDTAVAVHPNDERYREFIGKFVILPIVGRKLKIIADKYVDPSFGTGAVKITPAHDPNDYIIGQNHQLEYVEVIDKNGVMNENAGEYKGLDRFEAREKIVEDLEKLGYLSKVEDYKHSIGKCYRCGTVVEPVLSDQWFVKMKPLAQPAIEVVENGKIQFFPEKWKNFYLSWMYEIRDWCISRQLWWGHRIPVWYCGDCGHVNVAENEPAECEKCGSTNLKQDSDVLDTWFSSALWPFSTLGWPEETEDLKKYYPTDVLVTGFDIIFFWVAKMIIQGIEFMKEVPFRHVYIHQLVRDKFGRKMSKSLGNGIDPLEIIEKYGADSLRFTLAILAAQGKDIKVDEKYFEVYKRFINKIWNASRFVFMNCENVEKLEEVESLNLKLVDKWLVSKLNKTIRNSTNALENYEFNIAAKEIYEFFWGVFCDWYIEASKSRLNSDDENEKKTVQSLLLKTLDKSLRLLHPFMPFVTEEIWQKLPESGESISISSWPYPEEVAYTDEEEKFEKIMEVIRGIRNAKADMDIPQAKKLNVSVLQKSYKLSNEEIDYIINLANVAEINFVDLKPPKTVTAFIDEAFEVYVDIPGDVDFEAERKRLENRLRKLEDEKNKLEKKLSDEKFLKNAPEDIVEEKKLQYHDLTLKIERMKKLVEDLKI